MDRLTHKSSRTTSCDSLSSLTLRMKTRRSCVVLVNTRLVVMTSKAFVFVPLWLLWSLSPGPFSTRRTRRPQYNMITKKNMDTPTSRYTRYTE